MRKITSTEMIDLTGLLTMESNNLANAKTVSALIQDEELKRQIDAFIQGSEGKVKRMQQFINENEILTEVH